MNTRTLARGALVLAALATALAVVNPMGAARGKDTVTGRGHHSAPDTQFVIAARSGPAGQNPTGRLSFQVAGESRVKATVTCLVVAGNRAIATGTFRDRETGEAQLVVMEAVDNGTPGEAAEPDLLRFSFDGAISGDAARPGCYLPVLPPVPVTKGDISVHDA